MSVPEYADPERFRILASFAARRQVQVAEAAPGMIAHTDGHVIFVSADRTPDQQRREVLVQSALLGAGSLDERFVRRLRARPTVARRYLTLEGHRALTELDRRVPLVAALCPDLSPRSDSSEGSLEIATGRIDVEDPPVWFGTLIPSRVLRSRETPGSRASDRDLELRFTQDDSDEADGSDEDDDGPRDKSRILKLFEFPVGARTTADFLRKMFGTSRSSESEPAGGELTVNAMRRVSVSGTAARPLPTPIRFTDDGDRPGAAIGVGGALHPEWDHFSGRYRPQWCRVIDFPVTAGADVTGAGMPRDDVLRRRLSRVGLGPRALHARTDGDDLDTDALIDMSIDLRSGYSPPEHVYTERRKIARNLGVLILLDSSGSSTDIDSEGLTVHDHQRRAAATLVMTLEELGDRVALYAFRSHGRHAVHLLAVKTFQQRFGVHGRNRLDQLQPSGYTRLGAGIRGAGELLKKHAGTPNRLLVVLSDGFPYDDGYESRYAEADSAKAFEELRLDGIACLCLTIGASARSEALDRVFGPAARASAATLAELSPRMDELFLTALRELAAPRPRRG